MECQKEQKEKIPKNLEKYLPPYFILYGEPYIAINGGNYELKFSVPITDYFLNKFQEFYKLKNRPEPKEIYALLEEDTKKFLEKLEEHNQLLKLTSK